LIFFTHALTWSTYFEKRLGQAFSFMNRPKNTPNWPRKAAAPDPAAAVEDGFEEKLLNFWHANRTSILAGAALAVTIVVSLQGLKFLAARTEVSIQAVFQQVTTNVGLIAFAVDHPNHPLAGFSYLQVANNEYTDKKYEQAAYHYKAALEPLEGSPLAERARIGFAMTQLMLDNNDVGRRELEEIADEPSYLYHTRAEAAYNLAIFFLEAENYPAVTPRLDQIFFLINEMASLSADLDPVAVEQVIRNNIWFAKSQNLRARIPELH